MARATDRQVNARVLRRIRELDALEAAATKVLAGELDALQLEVRGVIAGQGAPVLAVLLADLERRFTLRQAAMLRALSDALAESATVGALLVDDVAALADLRVRLPAPDHAALLSRLRLQAQAALGSALEPARLGLTSQLSMLVSGHQDLAATLQAVGTGLAGSHVFGRALERTAGATSALMGEAAGAAQLARAAQLEGARSSTPPRSLEAAGEVVELRKRWISSHKSDARGTHAAAEGRYGPGGSVGPIAYGEDFQVGRFSTPYPRGPGLPGAQKVHCGCHMVPAVVMVPAALVDASGVDVLGVAQVAAGQAADAAVAAPVAPASSAPPA